MQMTAFGKGQGYLKAGFNGFNKSGKSFTAAELAIYLHKRLALKGPIALFDTEASGEYIAPRIKQATGQDMIGYPGRALVDLVDMTKQCAAGAASIMIVDSITHPWREICDSYLAQVNKGLLAARKSPRQRLEFQDWNIIKDTWNRTWTDLFLNSPLHIIICGRAGYEYAFQENEETGKKELIKTGTKMKTEGEFGFEPSLLIEMERVQVPDEARPGHFRLTHRATVIGDRFNVMDGAICENPTGDWFEPYIAKLTPGAVNAVDVALKTPMAADSAGDGEWYRERKLRTILCEKLHGELGKAFPSQTKEDKAARVAALEACFGTFSKTEIESMPSDRLRVGLAALAAKLNVPMIDPEAQSLDFGPAIEPKGE